jgi:hypothetical protein
MYCSVQFADTQIGTRVDTKLTLFSNLLTNFAKKVYAKFAKIKLLQQ